MCVYESIPYQQKNHLTSANPRYQTILFNRTLCHCTTNRMSNCLALRCVVPPGMARIKRRLSLGKWYVTYHNKVVIWRMIGLFDVL